MKTKAISELTKAESLLNRWKWLPGSQIKVMIAHLIKSLDAIGSYVLNRETSLDKDYLILSSVRLFKNKHTESEFYNTYFYLKNLLVNDIQRTNQEVVKIRTRKQDIHADKEFFETLINDVKDVINEAFNS